MSMRHCKDEHFLLKNTVHNAEGELMEDVAAAAGEINRPALRSLLDGGNGSLKLAFEIQRSG